MSTQFNWSLPILLISVACGAHASECKASADFSKSWKTDDGMTLEFRIAGNWSQQAAGQLVASSVPQIKVSFHYHFIWTDQRGHEHKETGLAYTEYSLGQRGYEQRSGTFSTNSTDKFFSREPVTIQDVSVENVDCRT